MIFRLGLVLFLLSTHATGSETSARPPKTIYVAPTGSDSLGEGSEQSPFATLAKATAALLPGDRVLLKGGTYPNTQVTVDARGTEKSHISISSVPGEKAILAGLGGHKGVKDEAEGHASQVKSVIDLRGARYLDLSDLEVAESSGYGINLWDSENITVKRCRIHHTWSRGLGGNGANLTFEDNEISDAVLQNENESVLIDSEKGINRYWSAAAATWYRPDGSLSKNVVWRRNRIRDSWGEGLSALHVDGAILERNDIADTYAALLYIDHSRNVTVDSNWLRRTSRKWTKRDSKDVAAGIAFAAEAYKGTPPITPENIRITNNIIANVSNGIAFWRDPDNASPTNGYRNVLIAYNLVKDASIRSLSIDPLPPGFDKGNGPLGRIRGNILYAPLYLWKPDLPEVTVRVENPESWELENNVLPQGLGSLPSRGFKRFTQNRALNPSLRDPRAINPDGAAGFRPICSALPSLRLKTGDTEIQSAFGSERPLKKKQIIGPWESCR